MEESKACDVTVCGLCSQQLCDAKLLPCLHSFCLSCLQHLPSHRLSGGKLACPTCQETSPVPDQGLSALPSNSFAGNLLRLRKTREDEKDVECDVCALEAAELNPVISYCLDCKQNMCEQCCSYHIKFASTKEHKVVPRGPDEKGAASLRLEDVDWCDKHQNRRQELYCRDCAAAICLKCFTDKHNSHTCSDIGSVADEFREQMQRNVEEMEKLTTENRSEECDLRRARDNIFDQVTEAECTVLRSREELIACIERDTNELMNDLQYFRDIVTDEFNVSSHKIKNDLRRLNISNSF